MILNMSSAEPEGNTSAPTGAGSFRDEDRTTKARIRDAAITCFAENGVSGTTARKVADAAGVSPGLVIHHFGSMEGLRRACDDHVATSVRRYKTEALASGPSLDVLAALRQSGAGPLAGYLAAVLVEDSPVVDELVDDLIADARGYLEQGVASGMVNESADPDGRAAVVMLWSLGALVMHRHLRRTLGVDLTAPGIGDDPALAAYALPAYEIFAGGMLTEEFGARARAAFSPTPVAPEGEQDSTE